MYYPVNVVASRLDVTSRTIRRYVKAGYLSSTRVMDLTCIPADEVEAFIADRTVAAA